MSSLVEQFEHRHPSTKHLLSFFENRDNVPDKVKPILKETQCTAVNMVTLLEDGPELTAGLRKLMEARNCFVRQGFEQDYQSKQLDNEPIEA